MTFNGYNFMTIIMLCYKRKGALIRRIGLRYSAINRMATSGTRTRRTKLKAENS